MEPQSGPWLGLGNKLSVSVNKLTWLGKISFWGSRFYRTSALATGSSQPRLETGPFELEVTSASGLPCVAFVVDRASGRGGLRGSGCGEERQFVCMSYCNRERPPI